MKKEKELFKTFGLVKCDLCSGIFDVDKVVRGAMVKFPKMNELKDWVFICKNCQKSKLLECLKEISKL